jgi:hypothetical protein
VAGSRIMYTALVRHNSALSAAAAYETNLTITVPDRLAVLVCVLDLYPVSSVSFFAGSRSSPFCTHLPHRL